MKVFRIIEAAFLMIILSVFIFGLEPNSPFSKEWTYTLFAVGGTGLHLLLIKAKTKWDWLSKNIDTQLGVLIIFAIFLSPLLVDLILFGFGK